jgi:hypothetical protein
MARASSWSQIQGDCTNLSLLAVPRFKEVQVYQIRSYVSSGPKLWPGTGRRPVPDSRFFVSEQPRGIPPIVKQQPTRPGSFHLNLPMRRPAAPAGCTRACKHDESPPASLIRQHHCAAASHRLGNLVGPARPTEQVRARRGSVEVVDEHK